MIIMNFDTLSPLLNKKSSKQLYICLNINMNMKTITIQDEAYKKISQLKGADESFSQLFIRIASMRQHWKKHIGVWKGLDSASLQAEAKKTRKELAEAIRQ